MSLSLKYFYKGRHRVPTHTKRNIATVTTATAITFGGSALVSPSANAEPPGGWGPIVQCESGGRNVENAGPSTASGYFQFVNGTWRAFGGGQFAPRAIGATLAEQTIVANRAYAANGLRDWNASRSCWAGKTGTLKINSKNAPKAVKKARTAATQAPNKINRPVAGTGRTHVVRGGDTLSKIAGDNWHKVYQKNKRVIGSNPHLIFPGQVIKV